MRCPVFGLIRLNLIAARPIWRGHLRLAQNADYGRNVVDALIEAEELVGAQLARLDGALDDDRAEAEDLGAATRQRRASYPLYRAA